MEAVYGEDTAAVAGAACPQTGLTHFWRSGLYVSYSQRSGGGAPDFLAFMNSVISYMNLLEVLYMLG